MIVEIDEAKFGRRKNYKGRIIEGQWVFAGVERDDPVKCFLKPAPDREDFFFQILNVLFTSTRNNVKVHCFREIRHSCVIDEFVYPGSIIVSDCWKAYHVTTKNSYTLL